MLRLLFVLLTASIAACDLSLTKISYTYNGDPCLNDCVNNICVTNYDMTVQRCSSGCQPAPKYRTSQSKFTDEFCLSRCGKFGASYEWCFVSQDGDWDYCSSETQILWIRDQHFTYDYGPCAGNCTYFEPMFGTPFYSCETFWNDRSIDRCHPDLRTDYVQAKTIEGEDCVGLCAKDGEDYFWCYNSEHEWKYCALPAKPPSLTNYANMFFAHGLACGKEDTLNGKLNDYAAITDCSVDGISKHNSVVEAAADKLESDFHNVFMQDFKNPIYSYTIREPETDIEPSLPLVVRAKISGRNTRDVAPESQRCVSYEVLNNLLLMRNRNDELGSIIGHQIGGNSETYNIIPQNHKVKCFWRNLESRIKIWVQNPGRTADITVVVIYDSDDSIPIGIGFNLILKNADGTIGSKEIDKVLCHDGSSVQSLFVDFLLGTKVPLEDECMGEPIHFCESY